MDHEAGIEAAVQEFLAENKFTVDINGARRLASIARRIAIQDAAIDCDLAADNAARRGEVVPSLREQATSLRGEAGKVNDLLRARIKSAP